MTNTKLKIELELNVIEIDGTLNDRLHGKAIAHEVGDVRFDGIQKGLAIGNKRIEAHLCFTLNNGDGTTILLSLGATANDIRNKKIEKQGIHNRK
jgi:hypothetical protein